MFSLVIDDDNNKLFDEVLIGFLTFLNKENEAKFAYFCALSAQTCLAITDIVTNGLPTFLA